MNKLNNSYVLKSVLARLRLLILSSSILIIMPGVWSHSVTIVEYAHLPAGLAACEQRRLDIYRVCGPVSKVLYSFPLYIAGLRAGKLPVNSINPRDRVEWQLGQTFQRDNRDQYHAIYRGARLVAVAVLLLGGVLVSDWSTSLFGFWPGIISLCMWCWMPSLLGHGGLVTSDVLATVMLILASRSCHAFLVRPDLIRALFVGVTIALGVATKFTLLVLYPSWTLILIVRVLHRTEQIAIGEETTASRIRILSLGFLSIALSFICIDAIYRFQEIGMPLVGFQPCSSLRDYFDWLRRHSAMAWLLELPFPLPLEVLRGIDAQVIDTERDQSAYMLGSNRPGGWWYWYVVAAIIKVPLPALGLFIISCYHARKVISLQNRFGHWAALSVLVPAAEAAIVIGAMTGTGTNAAFRYLNPSIGLLCVWVGCLGQTTSKAMRIIIAVMLAWMAFDALIGIPDHLGWQNEIGWAWDRYTKSPALIGDSLDWGQDLGRLSKWARSHAVDGGAIVCVYGCGSGDPYGLFPPLAWPTTAAWDHSGFLAVSENILFCYPSSTPGIPIGGALSYLTREQRTVLLRLPTYERIGRSIRVYSLGDLPVQTFPLMSLGSRTE